MFPKTVLRSKVVSVKLMHFEQTQITFLLTLTNVLKYISHC